MADGDVLEVEEVRAAVCQVPDCAACVFYLCIYRIHRIPALPTIQYLSSISLTTYLYIHTSLSYFPPGFDPDRPLEITDVHVDTYILPMYVSKNQEKLFIRTQHTGTRESLHEKMAGTPKRLRHGGNKVKIGQTHIFPELQIGQKA